MTRRSRRGPGAAAAAFLLLLSALPWVGCSLVLDPGRYEGGEGPADASVDLADGPGADARADAGRDAEADAGNPCDAPLVLAGSSWLPSGLFVVEVRGQVPDGRRLRLTEPERFFQHGETRFEGGTARLVYDAFRPVGGRREEPALLRLGEDETLCPQDRALAGFPVAPTIARVSDPPAGEANGNAESVGVANDGRVAFTSRAGNLPQDDRSRVALDAFLVSGEGDLVHLSPDAAGDCENVSINGPGDRIAFSERQDRGAADPETVVRVVRDDGRTLANETHGCDGCRAGTGHASDLRDLGGGENELVFLRAPRGSDDPRELLRGLVVGASTPASWLEVDTGFLDLPRLMPDGALSVVHGGAGPGLLLLTEPEESELIDARGIMMGEAPFGEGTLRVIGLEEGTRAAFRPRGGDTFEPLEATFSSALRATDDALRIFASVTVDGALAVGVRAGEGLDVVTFATLPRAETVPFFRGQVRSIAVSPNGRWLAYVDRSQTPSPVVRVQLTP